MSSLLPRTLLTMPQDVVLTRICSLGVVAVACVALAGCVDEGELLVDTDESATQPPLDPSDEDAEPGEEGSIQPLAAERADSPRFVPFEAIVKFRDDARGTARAALPARAELDELLEGISVVRFAADRSAAQDEVAATWAHIERLRARDDVEYAHPNWLFEPSRVPNDLEYPKQWHYPQINLPAAWDLTTGSPTVRIAILDSGHTAHPDQVGKMVGLTYDAVSEDGSALSQTTWNHGVAVASIAGGHTNNNGKGSAGVCWDCQLLVVRASDGIEWPQPNVAGTIRGIGWAVANGARVINMSFEIDVPCWAPATPHKDIPGLKQAIELAITKKNVTIVAAAGNKGVDAKNTSPASCPGVIAVAATDRKKQLAKYSNFGTVTLAAPGGAGSKVDGTIDHYAQGQAINCGIADPSSFFSDWTGGVVTNWTTSTGNVHCDRYISGTSFSAPHVAGVVGLMLSRNPNLTPEQIQVILENTAEPACSGCGAGLLDAHAAVRAAAPLPNNNDAKPVPGFTVKCTGLRCTFDASTSTDDQSIVAYEWILPGEQLHRGKVFSAFMPGYGNKNVRLRVTDNRGQSAMLDKYTQISQPAVTPRVGQYANPARPHNQLDIFETGDGGLAVTWYTFEGSGEPVWYTSGAGHRIGARWTQPLYRSAMMAGVSKPTQVGTISLDFSNATEVWLSWVLDDVPGGEYFTFQFGGLGRSGAWMFPSKPGRGISVQEAGGQLETNVTLYTNGGAPTWARSPRMTASSDQTLPLTVYKGQGLCPSCGGKTAASPDTFYTASMRLKVADGAATAGTASMSIYYQGMTAWNQSLGPIQLLTKP